MKPSKKLLTDEPPKDLRYLLQLDINEFINAAYRDLLKRPPDKEGADHFRRMLSYGLPREAVLFIIAESEEFGGRFLIRDMYIYRKIWKKYRRRKFIRKIPVIGWMYSMMANIYRMDSMVAELRFLNAQTRHELDVYMENLKQHVGESKEYLASAVHIHTDSLLSHMDNRADSLVSQIDNRTGDVERHIEESKGLISDVVHNRADLLVSHMDNHAEHLAQTVQTGSESINENVKDAKSQLESKLKYSMDTQRIMYKNLFSTHGMEDIQAELIILLNDKMDEFEAYNRLPIEYLAGYAEGKTLVAAHYSHLISEYATVHNMPAIEPAGIEPVLLPGLCQGKETLIIANPALSVLVLTSPGLLTEISRNLSRNLALVVRVTSSPINVVWEGFSFIEKDEKRGFFRWALGERSVWRIRLINTSQRSVEARLSGFAESPCGAGELTAVCCGETIRVDLNRSTTINLKITLQSGINDLEFNFVGSIKLADKMDARALVFRIIEFSCVVDKKEVELNFIYNSNFSLLSDEYIRQTLHKNGFYDITSEAYANHGMSKRELEKTRYELASGYRVINKADRYTIESDEIVCYSACRLRQTER